MEYLYFSVMVVSLGAVLAFWAVRSARPGNLLANRATGGKRGKRVGAAETIRFERGSEHGAKLETPWGWPGRGSVLPGESTGDADRGFGDPRTRRPSK